MNPWDYDPAHDLGLRSDQRRKSLRREPNFRETASLLFWDLAIRTYLRVWHRLDVRGAVQIPVRPPFVLAANHCSHLDALVLAAALPWRLRGEVFPLAAGDLFFETPGRSMFATSFMNCLPLWRRKVGRQALEQLRSRLLEGESVYIIFPQGTRGRSGDGGAFKAGLGMLVAGTEVPVVPCHLSGTFAALPPYALVPKPAKIAVRIGSPLTFADITCDRAGWQKVAARTEKSVRALGAEEPCPRSRT